MECAHTDCDPLHIIYSGHVSFAAVYNVVLHNSQIPAQPQPDIFLLSLHESVFSRVSSAWTNACEYNSHGKMPLPAIM